MDAPRPRQYSTYQYLTPLSTPIGTQNFPVTSYFCHGSSFMRLAHCLDQFDGDTSSAQWGVYYIKDILFDCNLTMVPRDNFHRSLLKGKITGTVADNLAMYTTAYGLCDIAVRLEGIPDEVLHTPTLRHRRQPGWIGENTCIHGLRDIKTVLQTFLRKGDALDLSVDVAPPCAGEDPCYALANYAVSAGAAKKAMNILCNISLAGFCISAMKKGHLEVPEDITRLAPTDAKIADHMLANLKALVTNTKHTRQVLQLAVCVSPLVLFLPIDLAKQVVCQEELLINHRRFGTEKPAQLQIMEDEVWQELFQLSDHVKTPSQVFMSCRKKADTWLKGCTLDPATSAFFAQESVIAFEPTMSLFTAYVTLPEGVHVSDATRFWIHDEDPPHRPLAIPPQPLNISSPAPAIPTQTPDVPLLTAAAPTLPPSRLSQTPTTPSQRPDTPSQTPATPTPPLNTKADKGKDKSAGVALRASLRLKAIDKSTQEPPAPRPATKPRKREDKRSTKAGLSGTRKGAAAQSSEEKGSSSGGEANVIPLVEYKGILAISLGDLVELNNDIAHKIEMNEGPIYQYTPKALLTLDTPTQLYLPHPNKTHQLWDATGKEYFCRPSIHNPADYEAWEAVFSVARTSQNGSARPFFLDWPNDSIVYRCTEAEYSALTDFDVQGILRRQNIVVTGCSDQKVKFNLTGLETLRDLDEPIDIQDQSIELDDMDPDFQQRVCQGTLRLLYDASVAPPGFDRSLNAIGLPMSEAGIRKAAYATDVRAFYRTKSEFACLRRGEATMVYVAEGQKLWVLAEPKDPLRLWSTQVWSTEEVDVRKLNYIDWHIEIVVLNAGDRLLMRPTTPHCVLTTENAICHGGHFLSASTLQRTVAGSIHTFFRGGVITNTDHPSFQGRMNTIACFFYKAIVLGDTHNLGEFQAPALMLHGLSSCQTRDTSQISPQRANVICPLSYKPTDDQHLVAMLKKKCGVSPDNALQKYDFSQSTHEMRVQNVHSRGRVIALLEFIFARIDVIDKCDGSLLDPWFELFIPTLAWFIHALRAYASLTYLEPNALFDRQLEWTTKRWPELETYSNAFSKIDSAPLELFWPEYPQVTVSPAHDPVNDDSDIDLNTDIPEERDLASQGLRAGDTIYSQTSSPLIVYHGSYNCQSIDNKYMSIWLTMKWFPKPITTIVAVFVAFIYLTLRLATDSGSMIKPLVAEKNFRKPVYQEGRGEREQIIAHVGHNVLTPMSSFSSQQMLVNRESRDEDQFYADWGLGSPHTASSKHRPLVNPTLSPSSLGAAEADISSIMDDVRLDNESSMYDLSPETVDHILAQHGEALMLHQAALWMHRVSSIALSEIKRRKNALFGEGVWIIHHLDNLDEAQHRAARKAMARWDTVYQEGLNRAAHRLLFSVAHCSPSYPEFPHDSENL
ncbi:hypothetical protein BKA70DRAFT_1223778 [Coprinopsis sp. MPI-PUGE-AT-0042]|nr:hypothetical protein BKA70DRAFT_1223778 [Coprinopsis sp. MPI-PUGE-AT-0042]